MAFEIPKESFLALAAVAWADGRLQKKEGIGLLHAAKSCGLSDEDLAVVEAATLKLTPFEEIELSHLSEAQKVVTYSLAYWLARLDGVVTTDEHKSLAALGEILGLREALRLRASAVALDIAMLPDGGRPDKYDFQALAKRLQDRLPQVTWELKQVKPRG
jgi:tellurite resistance protein